MTTIDSIDNGVNVQALLDAREVLKGAPEAAQFTWRSTTRWENGVHTTSTGMADVGTRDGLRVLVEAYVVWEVPPEADAVTPGD